jgi:ketosteroid isomerase-like protein
VSVQDQTDAEQRNVDQMRRLMILLSDGRSGLEKVAREAPSLMHPDLEWTPALFPQGKRVYRGIDEYRAYLEEVATQQTERSYVNVQEIRPVDADRVLMLSWVHHEGADGARYEGEYALLARIEDGLIRELTSFATFAEAERAAADA